jgi:hypothetical protein
MEFQSISARTYRQTMKTIFKSKTIGPALTLIFLAPLIAEILPGATRFSSIFVFPVEMCVWGIGALLIRNTVRKFKLGWTGMLFLALALSVAEEFLIQQTSAAPLVIQLKGVTYARIFGINYVYLVWALIYEAVFVVFLPVYLTELLFPKVRSDQWSGRRGTVAGIILFSAGCFAAWFTWTQIARPKVFHVEKFNPPTVLIVIALITIALLIISAFSSGRFKPAGSNRKLKSPTTLILGILSSIWAILLYGVVLLAYGIRPDLPPVIPLLVCLMLGVAAVFLIQFWVCHHDWNDMHIYALITGTITGSMLAGFIGFIGAVNADLIFKVVIDILAIMLLIILGLKIRKRTNSSPNTL